MKIKKLLPILFFSLTLVFAGNFTTVIAEETTDEELDQAAEKYNEKQKYDGRKLICKKETVIGSRIKKKVCRTVASIERDREEAKRMMDKRQRKTFNRY